MKITHEQPRQTIRTGTTGGNREEATTKRTLTTSARAAATLAFACSTALIFAATTVQARPTHTAGSHAVTAATVSTCKTVITAAPWRIRTAGGSVAGDKYTIAGKAASCSAARTWVTRFTHQQDTSPIKGPAGFTCRSFSTATSGDKLLYSGICMHPPHNIPFFEWAPKIPRP
jgi:hypothetical protein